MQELPFSPLAQSILTRQLISCPPHKQQQSFQIQSVRLQSQQNTH